ncbi:MAG: T9SS type A sorting domain-containing protein [Cytophagaceae bacterium]|jgi:hypothetical protein|nr:T9SS type A sorting domain-containing protein [Cytophagaceae bacterium]
MKKIVFIVLHIFISFSVIGNNIFISPLTSGLENGVSWNNSFSYASLDQIISTLQPGDTLNISGGANLPRIIFNGVSGTSTLPIVVQGHDLGTGLPTHTGTWVMGGSARDAECGIRITNGSDFLVIKNFRILSESRGVLVDNTSENDGIHLINIGISIVNEGIKAYSMVNSSITNCTFIKYTKRGVRIEQNCFNLNLTDCIADGTAGDPLWRCDAFPFGFTLEAQPNIHDVTYRNCISQRNYHERGPSDYWNGDGFTAEPTSYNVKYFNCEAYENSDGGWDDKSAAAYLENCVSLRNKRAFRIWNVNGGSNPTILKNCLGAYSKSYGGSGSQVGLWTSGYTIADFCTFHNNASGAVSAETGTNCNLTVRNSVLSANLDFLPNYNSENHIMTECTLLIETSTASWISSVEAVNPQFENDSPSWRNLPITSFNNTLYGSTKGYYRGVEIVDNCPNDPLKTEPGNCGCGNSESSCIDCHGVVNGNAFIDLCNRCAGGTTGLTPCVTTNLINTSSNINEVQVYPNPFSSSVTISSNQDIDFIEIYNLEGLLLRRIVVQKNIIVFDPNLIKGVYLFKVISKHSLFIQKVIQD